MNLKLFFLIAPLFGSQSITAQNRPEDISTSFLNQLKIRTKDTALIGFYRNTNPVISTQLQEVLKNQFKKIDSSDKLNDWLWICDMELTKDLVLKSFLLKYNKKPLRLDILFYKRTDTWCIQDASVSDELFSDLRNAGRAEKIKPNNLVITY